MRSFDAGEGSARARRFGEVVERMDLKSTDCILIVRGYKYHNGGCVWRCSIRAVLSARSSRSLRFGASGCRGIERRKARSRAGCGGRRRLRHHSCSRPGDFDVGVVLQAGSGRELIIGDKGPDSHCGIGSYGMEIATSKPPRSAARRAFESRPDRGGSIADRPASRVELVKLD